VETAVQNCVNMHKKERAETKVDKAWSTQEDKKKPEDIRKKEMLKKREKK
jgi:hypothetical protein